MESISYNPVEAYLKTTKLLCLILVLFVSITSGSIWARGGHGGGHHGGGHHFDGAIILVEDTTMVAMASGGD